MAAPESPELSWTPELPAPPWPSELPAPTLVPEWALPWRPPVLSPCPLRPPECPPPPPHWMLYGAGRACWEGGVMSDLCPHVLCLPASCTHIWSFLFPVQLVPAVCFDFVQGVSS